MRNFRYAPLIAFFLSVLFPLSPGSAQQEEESLPVIHRIIPEFQNFRAVSEQYVLNNIQLRPGMNYNPALIDQSVRALYNSGHFEFVEVRVEKAPAEEIDVYFELTSKYTIQRIRFNGNEAFTDGRLASKAEIAEERTLESGMPLDEYRVSVAADALAADYVEKGYPDAVVDYRIQRDDENGYAVVNFDIEEGGDVRIEKVNFTGNEVFKDGKLRKQLETKRNSLISWLTGTGKYDEKQFKDDLDALRKF